LMTVSSHDSAGNVSAPSAPLTVTTPPDTTKPTVPAGLNAGDVTATSFTLTWTASTDNVRVIGYDVFRNGVLLGSTPIPAFAATGLAPSTLSQMRVKARDAAGNLSGFSAILAVTTSARPNVPPTVVLTTPADGFAFTLPFTLTLTGVATDSDGIVAKVGFYDGGILIGETATPSAPNTFSYQFTPITAGPHALTARATDNQNATADSAAVGIAISNPNHSRP